MHGLSLNLSAKSWFYVPLPVKSMCEKEASSATPSIKESTPTFPGPHVGTSTPLNSCPTY